VYVLWLNRADVGLRRRGLNQFRNMGVEPKTFVSEETIQRIGDEFARVKPKFLQACDKCGATIGVRRSWCKLDMAFDGEGTRPRKAYLYFWPTMQSHATTYRLGPRFMETTDGFRFEPGPQPREADAALAGRVLATAIVLDFQDHHVGLGRREELELMLNEYLAVIHLEGSPEKSGS
jgi:hypothetical protein